MPWVRKRHYGSRSTRTVPFDDVRFADHRIISEMPIPVHYDGVDLGIGLRLDLLVEESVIVETKSVRKLREVDDSQILSHLQLCQCKKGLLINFNVRHLRRGIRRFVR